MSAGSLFDTYVAVDWSASNRRTSGADSIWIGVADNSDEALQAENLSTRRAAEEWLLQRLVAEVAKRRRVLIGLDFSYGYPAGFAQALGLHGQPWKSIWAYLEKGIQDDASNKSNRFDVANTVNERLGDGRPFWSRPGALDKLQSLPYTKDVSYASGPGGFGEWRQVELELRERGGRPQSVWQLAGVGAVGSQSLLGIPTVARIREDDRLRDVSRVWPFEIESPVLPPGAPAVIHVEIWPTLAPFGTEEGTHRDEQQVRAVVREWRDRDRVGDLARDFADLPNSEAVRNEEGWILGARRYTKLKAQPPSKGSAATSATATSVTSPPLSTAVDNLRAPCRCGCGGVPRGKRSRFMPGHDQRINPETGQRFNAH
jgi:hypothetical protein